MELGMTPLSRSLRQGFLQKLSVLGAALDLDLYAQRDDLLPFPLGGNKVRKILQHLLQIDGEVDILLTNGSVNSNHCRTLAMIGAALGINVHLVLHSGSREDERGPALALLRSLGAEVMVVPPSDIARALKAIEEGARSKEQRVAAIPGGCHSPAGALAYRDIGRTVLAQCRPDVVFLASGTGATQGGLIAAAAHVTPSARIVGVSVARPSSRGKPAVAEAASWAGSEDPIVEFDDSFRAGGYGAHDSITQEAVRFGLAHGLPLDPTYTGKAFAALLAYARRGDLRGKRVLFWHTGGLWNLIESLPR